MTAIYRDQGARRPEAAHRRGGRGARCCGASRGDASRNSFHRWTCPEIRRGSQASWRGSNSPRHQSKRKSPRSPGTRSVKGVRPVRNDNRSIAWMLDSGLERGFQALENNSLSLDILVQNWREIPLAALFAKRWPGLAIVLDHCGKPDIARRCVSILGRRHIDELASLATRRMQALRVVELRLARSGRGGLGSLHKPCSGRVRSGQRHVGERLAAPGPRFRLCNMETHLRLRIADVAGLSTPRGH